MMSFSWVSSLIQQLSQFLHKGVHILELPVNGSKADVGHLVQPFSFSITSSPIKDVEFPSLPY